MNTDLTLNRALTLAGLPLNEAASDGTSSVKFGGKMWSVPAEWKYITRDSSGLVKYHKEKPVASSDDKWDCSWSSKGEKVISGMVESLFKEV